MEAEIPQGLVDLFSDARRPGEDPAVHQAQSAPCAVGSAGADFRRGQLLDRRASTLEFVEVDEQKPRGIPDFIGEGAVALDALFAPDDVGARRRQNGQRETHGVGAVLLVQCHGVDARALGFGHLLPFGIAHDRVQVHFAERHLAHESQPHHDHPRDPEEQDLVSGDEQAGWIIDAQVFGLVRPTQRGERPQRGAEPGVEHVGILLDLGRATLCAL